MLRRHNRGAGRAGASAATIACNLLPPAGIRRARPSRVTTMNRTLLALCLLLLAAVATAAEPLPPEAEPEQCPKAEAAREKAPPADASKASGHPAAPATVRPRGTAARGTPRWHSLLPGMFR
jgi:hypothetical protein